MNKFIKDIKHIFNFAALKKWGFKTRKFKKIYIKLILGLIKLDFIFEIN